MSKYKFSGMRALVTSIVTAHLISGAGCSVLPTERYFGVRCTQLHHVQPSAVPRITDVDIVIVPDTSSSFNQERQQVANGIDQFVAGLPKEMNYTVGVILGHGPASSRHGKFYQKYSEPVVLSSEIHTIDEIRAGLLTKLDSPAMDGDTDGGEIGMLSMATAVTSKLAVNRAQGGFREGAALVVIFLADENDICATYPSGVVPVPDFDNKEIPAKAKYCTDHIKSPFPPFFDQVTFVEILKDYLGKDLPLIVTGVLYNNLQTFPPGDENELGYGYLEAAALTGSPTADMASPAGIPAELKFLGELVGEQLVLKQEFDLAEEIGSPLIDESTISVYIDGVLVPRDDWSYSQDTGLLTLSSPGGPNSEINILFCRSRSE